MSTQHTPGPWYVSPNYFPKDPDVKGCVFEPTSSLVIAETFQSEADTCLIASAPELLDALEDSRQSLVFQIALAQQLDPHEFKMMLDKSPRSRPRIIEKIDAAIQKAKGQK